MDRQSAPEKLKSWKTKGRIGLGWGVGTAVGVTVLTVLFRIFSHGGGHRPDLSHFMQPVRQAWQSVQDKMDGLARSERENYKLKLENAYLRLQVESLQFGCREKQAVQKTKDFQVKLSKETGTKVGRTLAGLQYKIPDHLLPPQLYSLGVSYFKDREDEKSAAILTLLTGLEDNEAYKTPQNYLMAGISWYRLDNFALADHYFDEVLKQPEAAATLRFQGQARLWKGLTASRLSKKTKAQFWLRELLDHHPHSMEAKWVNVERSERSHNPEVKRATASEH